jgi:hypothetical protein
VSGGQGAGAAGFLLARVERERRRWPSLLSLSLSLRGESRREKKKIGAKAKTTKVKKKRGKKALLA